MNTLTIPAHRGKRLVEIKNIIRVEGCSNYSKIFFATGHPITVAKVLHWFEDQLPPQMFARVHRSHLVNKIFMHEINVAEPAATLLLTNGESIAMSRRKRLLELPQ